MTLKSIAPNNDRRASRNTCPQYPDPESSAQFGAHGSSNAYALPFSMNLHRAPDSTNVCHAARSAENPAHNFGDIERNVPVKHRSSNKLHDLNASES